jgi:hypothetical protein
MPEKPRVKAPKQRASSSDAGDRSRTALIVVVAAFGVLLGAIVVFALVGLGGGGGGIDEEETRATLEAAGCTLQIADAQPAEHSVVDPSGSSDRWNTDPPTTGPHYRIAAIFGIYDEPLEQARVVHNLEHGGVFVQYGEDVPASTVEQLRAFYDDHKTGTIMAPYPKLGDQFALGAWVKEPDFENGYLAKCKTFDEEAASAFLSAFQFRGPERFDPADLRPGH